MTSGADGAGRRSPRGMTLVAPLQARNFMTARYCQRIARTLEVGKVHLAFFAGKLHGLL